MNCREVQDHLVDHLYGELDQDLAQRLQAHLESCPSCMEELEALLKVKGLLLSRKDPVPSSLLTQRILAHAGEEISRPKGLWGLGWLRAAVPVCFLLVVGGWILLYQGWHRPGQEESGPGSSRGVAPQAGEPALMPDHEAPPQSLTREEKTRALPAPPPPLPDSAAKPSLKDKAMAALPSPPPQETSRLPAPQPRPQVGPHSQPPGGAEGQQQEMAVGKESRRQKVQGMGAGAPVASPPPEPSGDKEGLPSELSMGEKLIGEKDFTRAEEIFSRLINTLPPGHASMPRVLLGLAQAREGLGELGEASALYQRLAGDWPEYRELALEKLRVLEQLRRSKMTQPPGP
jgi:anti-sigma factor (TIGR02949 family)